VNDLRRMGCVLPKLSLATMSFPMGNGHRPCVTDVTPRESGTWSHCQWHQEEKNSGQRVQTSALRGPFVGDLPDTTTSPACQVVRCSPMHRCPGKVARP